MKPTEASVDSKDHFFLLRRKRGSRRFHDQQVQCDGAFPDYNIGIVPQALSSAGKDGGAARNSRLLTTRRKRKPITYMKATQKKSLIITAALTGLLGGTVSRVNADPLQDQSQTKMKGSTTVPEKHSCAGKNSCKGKGGCATDGSKVNNSAKAHVAEKHACAGQNSCKGNGGCATNKKQK